MHIEHTANQKILHGIDSLPEILSQIGCRRMMLVVDSSFPYLNIKPFIEQLAPEKIVFDQFTPNPLYEDVCKGVELLRSSQCDVILAVGGGSSMDVAKCIKLFSPMEESKNYLEQPFESVELPLIAIPTTAGTGSESTRYAVIYFEGKKQSITHQTIIPDYAVLEPSVLATLPLYQKKCTFCDALCQGIESWWSVNSNQESMWLSRQAISTLIDNMRGYLFHNDPLSAAQVMQAANWAGQAICITQTTAAHAFSYKITSLFGLPHGHAVAVCLPKIWDYMLAHPEKSIDPRGSQFVMDRFTDIARAMDCETPQEAIQFFNQMMVELSMGAPHSESAEQRAEQLDQLASSVNPVRLKNNPIELDIPTTIDIYKHIVQ